MTSRASTIGLHFTGALLFQELAESADAHGAAIAIRAAIATDDLPRALEDAMAAGFVITFSDGDLTVLFNQ